MNPYTGKEYAIGLRIPRHLYDGFAGAMFSLALEVLGDRWEAEEVIQDVFAYIWRNQKLIPGKAKVYQLVNGDYPESEH